MPERASFWTSLLNGYSLKYASNASESKAQKGEAVDLHDTINDMRKILDGSTNSKDVEALTYIGKLL